MQQTITVTTSKRLELVDITRQGITLVELDGPRKREMIVDVRP